MKMLEWEKYPGIESYYLKVNDVISLHLDYEFNVKKCCGYWSIYIHYSGEYNATKIADGIETIEEAKEKAFKIANTVLEVLDSIKENN